MNPQQSIVRALLQQMMVATDSDPTGLAKLAGISPSTLTRFLNSKRPPKGNLSLKTLHKLSAASGIPIPLFGGNSPETNPSLQKKAGQFVEDQDELALLAFWRGLLPDERRFMLNLIRNGALGK